MLHEVAMDFDELQMQPHIVFVAYEQQIGIKKDQLIDTCGQSASMINSELLASDPCPINLVIDKFLSEAPSKTMVALLPHGIDVEKFDRVEEHLRSSMHHNHNRQQRSSSSSNNR